MPPKAKPDDPEQSRRFLMLAQEHGADGTDASLRRAVEKISHAPRAAETSKPAKKKAPKRPRN
jgi:hypothetical protein